MKKILFLAVILCLASCDLEDNTKPTAIQEKGIPFGEVIEFKYKKHSYIKFDGGCDNGVVHDPECPECYAIFD